MLRKGLCRCDRHADVPVLGVTNLADAQGCQHARKQRHGELQPVVCVKLQFREKIRTCDAEERACAESQGRPEPSGMGVRQRPRPQEEQERAKRSDEGERSVDEMQPAARGSTCRHQSGNRQGAERFVQDHGQCRAYAQSAPVPMPLRHDGGGQGEPVKHRVQREANSHSDPIEMGGRQVAVGVEVAGAIRRLAFRYVVVMKGQEALQEEHDHETAQQPLDTAIDGFEFRDPVRQEVQKGQAQHQTRHEAHPQLQAGMSKPKERRQPAAKEGGAEHEQTVDRHQNYTRGFGHAHHRHPRGDAGPHGTALCRSRAGRPCDILRTTMLVVMVMIVVVASVRCRC